MTEVNPRKKVLFDLYREAYQATTVAYRALTDHWRTHFFGGACTWCSEGRRLEQAHKDACAVHRALGARYEEEPW